MSEKDAELRCVYFKNGHDCHGWVYLNDAGSEYVEQNRGFGDGVEVAHTWNPKTKRIAGSFLFVSDECDHHDFPADNPTTWRWENPDEPTEDITLSPSIGVGRDQSGGWDWHCYVRDGEVDNL